MRAWVYIDGFNLYRRAIRPAHEQGLGNFRWLDLVCLSRRLLPSNRHQVERVKWFTALVNDRPNDPTQRSRQQTYWAALSTLPEVEIIKGHFSERRTRAPRWSEYERLCKDESRGLCVAGQRMKTVEILKAEEKGSDVNLAVHLVSDAYQGRFEKALVISNDSDIACALRVVRDDVGLPVVICNPDIAGRATTHLTTVSTAQRTLRVATLQSCQLPDPVVDPVTGRAIHKPPGW